MPGDESLIVLDPDKIWATRRRLRAVRIAVRDNSALPCEIERMIDLIEDLIGDE